MFMNKILRSATLGFAAVLMMAAPAMAQSKVLVVDIEKVITDSEVGKHIVRQVTAIGETMNTELDSKKTPLKSNTAALSAELKGKSPDEQLKLLQSRPDLAKKYQDSLVSQQELVTEGKYKQAELARTEQKALLKVGTKVREIIVQVAKERNADVVLDKSRVVYGDPVDITDTVLSRLNTQMPRTTVVRERLPRQQAPTASASGK